MATAEFVVAVARGHPAPASMVGGVSVGNVSLPSARRTGAELQTSFGESIILGWGPAASNRRASVSGLQRWSGLETRALREALRMSVRVFAAHLGVSNRTVSKWEAGGEQLTPLPDSQALLDTALERADAAVRERFRDALSDPRALRVLPSGGGLVLVPSPEPDLIQRSDDVEALVSIVLETSSAKGPKVVAVSGPGGFGKTTLTTQVCHEPRVVDLFNEILWVETGEDCAAARVVELVSDLCVHLDGTRPALTDPEQAGFHLARVLNARRLLLVVDNVWSAADLAPFLLGGPECVRLVTTRNLRVCAGFGGRTCGGCRVSRQSVLVARAGGVQPDRSDTVRRPVPAPRAMRPGGVGD